MKPLSRYTIILSSCFFLLLPKKIARACGFYVLPEEYRFWLMQPDIVNMPDLSPFYFSADYLFGGSTSDVLDKLDDPWHRVNVGEWYSFAHGAVPKKDIEEILYDTPPDDFLNDFKGLEASNAFARWLSQPAHKEFLQYMQLAKKLEELNERPDPWNEGKPSNPKLQLMIDDAIQFYNQCKFDFTRIRVAYQAMYLYKYCRLPNEAVRFYNEKITPIHINSWIKAAAAYQLGLTCSGPEY